MEQIETEIKNFNVTGLLAPQIPHSVTLINAFIKHGFAFDSSPTGTGKTFSAAAVIRYLIQIGEIEKFVVICPKLGIPKWKKILKEFGLEAQFVLNYEKVARGNLKKIYRYKTKGQKATFVLSKNKTSMRAIPHFLRGEWRIPKTWLVILDESHRMKGVESLQAGMGFALKNQGFRVVLLSATQAMKPMDLRSFGFMAGLHQGMSVIGGYKENYGMNQFKQFCERAGAEFTGHFGSMVFDSSSLEKRQQFVEVVHKPLFDVKQVASRMNRADFGDIFKKNQIEASVYDMGENGKKINHAYQDMKRELARLEKHTANYQAHVLSILTATRMKVELLKVPTFCEQAEDLWDEGKSILFFVNYTQTIEVLFARLSKKFGEKWIGGVYSGRTIKQRLDDIAALQNDTKRIMVNNVAAGGENVDMHDLTGKHPRASKINPGFRAISIVQAIGRPDRAHAQTDILTDLPMAAGTVEESVAANFNPKKDQLDLLNDGDLIPDGIGFAVASVASGRDL